MPIECIRGNMKLLMFYTHEWWFKTASKTLAAEPDVDAEAQVDNAVVVFFHAEAKDEAEYTKVLQKFIKNTKWLAGKFGTRNVVLHSFNHLSISKASPELSKKMLTAVIRRLENINYQVMVTPFGYFNEFRMHVAGDSLAKVYKEF